jgi:glycosyltransferase involved in cell wall biosynthesis
LSRRKVLVFNQFAMPRTQWGLTRNAELFSRLTGWDARIVAANRDHYGQGTFTTTDPLFTLVPVPAYAGSSVRRVAGWVLFAARATAIGLRTRGVDAVYGSSPHLLAPLAAWVVAAARRKPLVVEVRDLWPESIVEAGLLRRESRLHRLLVGLETFLYRRARSIVVVTPGWEDHFARLGIDLAKVVVIPNGTDVDDKPVDRGAARTRHGITGFTAVYAGAHGPANGLDQVLDAAKALPEVRVLLLGAGSEKARLMERAAREAVTNVEFRDPVPKDELREILAACDVGIHVLAPWQLLQAGLSPNKVFDYLAAGLPVVSNCATGLRDVMTDGECGRLGGPDDLTGCLSAVHEASDHQRALWATAGRTLVTDRFSRTASATLLESVLVESCRGPEYGHHTQSSSPHGITSERAGNP